MASQKPNLSQPSLQQKRPRRTDKRLNTKWQTLRRVVIARAGGMCEQCKKSRGEHVHHLRYAEHLGDEPPEWLLFLCCPCHQLWHPHHTFRSQSEQRAIRKKRLVTKRPKCAHCGNSFSPAKHEAICVRYGLTKRRK